MGGHAAVTCRASGALRDVIPDPSALLEKVRAGWPPPGSRSGWLPAHSENHWREVGAWGVRLLEAGCPADPAALFIFSIVHDSRRRNDWFDDEHADRAADLARELRAEGMIVAGDEWFAALTVTLQEHDLRRVADCPTVGAAWDADRLSLPRLGTRVDERLLSTPQARALVIEAEALGPRTLDWPELIARFEGDHVREERYEQQRRAMAERRWEELTRPPAGARFYHGSRAGFRAGDRILPGALTGAPGNPDSAQPYRRDRAYVATSPWPCVFYAGPLDGRYADGSVYQVRPEGVLEADIPGLAWACTSAVVERVVRSGISDAEYRSLVDLCWTAVDRLEKEHVPRLPRPDDAAWDVLTITDWPPLQVVRVIGDLVKEDPGRVDPEFASAWLTGALQHTRPTYSLSGSDDAP